MSRPRSPMTTRVAMGALLLGVTIWLYRPGAVTPTEEHKAAPVAQVIAAPAPAIPDLGLVLTPAPPPPADEPSNAAQKHRMAAEGEAARIAARENKLAKLDWNAARPDPPEERPLTSKAEAEMEPAERLEQTERMIGRLKDRIDRIEVRARRAGQTGDQAGSDGTLVKRLRLRVSQLEDTARELRGQEQADVPPTEVPR